MPGCKQTPDNSPCGTPAPPDNQPSCSPARDRVATNTPAAAKPRSFIANVLTKQGSALRATQRSPAELPTHVRLLGFDVSAERFSQVKRQSLIKIIECLCNCQGQTLAEEGAQAGSGPFCAWPGAGAMEPAVRTPQAGPHAPTNGLYPTGSTSPGSARVLTHCESSLPSPARAGVNNPKHPPRGNSLLKPQVIIPAFPK